MKPQGHARGLGAQMQFTKQHRSKVLLDRVNELTTMWPKLRQSLSPYFLKVRVLSRAAWPKGLHAVGATHLGLSRFGALRSGAMRGIEATGSGCNAWVHLGMIESPEADPQFWSIKETIRGVRLCQSEAQMAVLFEVATHESFITSLTQEAPHVVSVMRQTPGCTGFGTAQHLRLNVSHFLRILLTWCRNFQLVWRNQGGHYLLQRRVDRRFHWRQLSLPKACGSSLCLLGGLSGSLSISSQWKHGDSSRWGAGHLTVGLPGRVVCSCASTSVGRQT